MYQVEASKALLKPSLWARHSSRLRVPRNVVMLGMVSLLTDVSSEMVATVLPLYLVFTLGASPLVFGAIDGTYRGAAAAGPGGQRLRLRPLAPAQGGRRPRLRDLRGGQGGAGRRRQHDRRHRRDRRLRPGRQGDPHGAPRRPDLPLQRQGEPRHLVRRAPGDGQRRGDAGPAGRLRHPASSPPPASTPSSWSARCSPCSASPSWSSPSRAARAGRRASTTPAPSFRAAVGLVARPALRPAAAGRRRPLDRQRLRRDDLRRPAAQDRLRAGDLPAALRDHRRRLHGPGDPLRPARRPGRQGAGAAGGLRACSSSSTASC